ncbi:MULTISPECIES: TonB-dependent receptor [Burkholderia]|uniref:TonB-dependent receptor n=1 Tax=Burkholderia TaxID=32008 RepID=UPI001F217594|nr:MULTISPECIES: TonB-dependent receptor [Burkholderia]
MSNVANDAVERLLGAIEEDSDDCWAMYEEIGRVVDGRLDATAALFRINDNNRAVADPWHPDFFLAEGHVRDQGVELDVTGQPTPDWNLYAGLRTWMPVTTAAATPT